MHLMFHAIVLQFLDATRIHFFNETPSSFLLVSILIRHVYVSLKDVVCVDKSSSRNFSFVNASEL